MGVMNEKRAEWAYRALQAFAQQTGQKLNEEAQEAIGDLICDLLHLGDQYGMDATELTTKALNAYEGEIQDGE